jgi:hypothetical protein
MIRELAHATHDYIPTLFVTKNFAFKVCSSFESHTFTASGMSVTADGCLFTSDAISFGIVAFSLNLNRENPRLMIVMNEFCSVAKRNYAVKKERVWESLDIARPLFQ